MRTGINPNKLYKEGKGFREVTAGILVNIPNTNGYYDNSMPVLEECIKSSKNNTDIVFDLLVVDNGSVEEVRELLMDYHKAGVIDYLIFNKENLGRPNGVRQILNSSPGNYVSYSDCDIYFKQGWLESELDLLKNIPNTGFVSGMPNSNFTDYFTEYTVNFVERGRDFKVEKGKLIPREYLISFAESLGYENITEPMEIWDKKNDIRINYKEMTAYVGASHMQFITKKELIHKLPFNNFKSLTGCNDEIIDKYVNEFGYLRLSTEHPVIHHMGNKPYERSTTTDSSSLKGNTGKGNFLNGFKRRLIGKIYDWSFKKYYSLDSKK